MNPALRVVFLEGAPIAKPAPPVLSTPGRITIQQVHYERHNPGVTSSVREAVTIACRLRGVPPGHWIAGYETATTRESSQDPSAVNGWDSNAWGPTQSDGYPLHCSRGIAQCIPDTFAEHHQAGTSLNIYDTVANIAASMDYVIHSPYGVAEDGSNLAANVPQFDPNHAPHGY